MHIKIIGPFNFYKTLAFEKNVYIESFDLKTSLRLWLKKSNNKLTKNDKMYKQYFI